MLESSAYVAASGGRASLVKWCSIPRVGILVTPASISRHHRFAETVILGHVGVGAVLEGHVSSQGNVVESEVENTRIRHAIRQEGHESSHRCSSKNIVPVVRVVDDNHARYDHGYEYWSNCNVQCPERWSKVAQDLEFCIQVQGKEDEASKGCRGVSRGEGREGVFELFSIPSRACIPIEDNSFRPFAKILPWRRLANVEEVWA